jgi:hypothetical protein
MRSSAEAEGAFRFLESKRVDSDCLIAASGRAAAASCCDAPFVFVAVDQTELAFVDRKHIRGLGPNQNRLSSVMRSTHVMTALALDERGVPLGVLDQQWWVRPDEQLYVPKKDRRPAEDRETWYWIRAVRAAARRLSDEAPDTRPWFVMDRGADFSSLLVEAKRSNLLLTVRSSNTRAIEKNGRRQYMRATLARQAVLGTMHVVLPKTPQRPRRSALLELRALRANTRVDRFPDVYVDMHCLRIREIGPVPVGAERIEWFLLTTHPIATLEDAQLVTRSYVYRWRIEEFHKAWKSGTCGVEHSQLRSFEAIKRWGSLLAAVAARAERLKLMSRSTPDVDALQELSREEIDAAIVLSNTKKWKPGDPMDLVTAVRLVATVGGFLGRKGDGAPGTITIARGLESILPAAAVLRATRSSG